MQASRIGETTTPLKKSVEPGLEGCEAFIGTMATQGFTPIGSLEELTGNTRAVVSGTVVAMRQGFYRGLPGTLLRLNANYMKGVGRAETYLFYQLARIQTSGGLICARPLGPIAPPELGDRFLIFSLAEPSSDYTVFFVDASRQLVHEHKSRRVILPLGLRAVENAKPSSSSVAGATFDQVQRNVEASIHRHSRVVK